MQVEETAIPAVKIVTPKKHGDARGFFSEVYSRSYWDKAGLDFTFVQDNHSYSAAGGTLRGLHFQTPPFAQAKLVRCARGRILDVAVDIRRSSPTFGQHVAVELSAENCWLSPSVVPIGFAHVFHDLGARLRGSLQNDRALFRRQRPAGIVWDDRSIGFRLAAAGRRSRSVGQGLRGLAPGSRTRRTCSNDAYRGHRIEQPGRDLAHRARWRQGRGRRARPAGVRPC